MKNIGIIRKIDDLGRIVLPKELRNTLNINSGDDFQITIDDEKIILEKYSKLENYEEIIIKIINCFSYVLKYDIYFVINNKIINFEYKEITNVISNIISSRKMYISDKNDKNIISNELIKNGKLVILPLVFNSDLLGAIIIVSNDNTVNITSNAKIIDNLIKTMLLRN